MSHHPPADESRLIDLVAGLLTKEDSEETLGHIRRCSECEQRLRALVSDYETLRGGAMPRMVDGHIQVESPKRRLVPGRWVVVAAAVVVLASVAAIQLSRRGDAREYWIPVGGEAAVLRSAGGSDSSQIQSALQPYQDRDPEAAIEQLTALQIPYEDVTAISLRGLYLASAYLNANRPEEALQTLKWVVVAWLPAPWRWEAQWVEYLALVRLDRRDEARIVLEMLSQEPNEFGARARAELERWDD
jgi:hypothetical protein